MRPLADLINTAEPGWPLVQRWIDSATNRVEVLQADATKAADALYQTQVTTRSPMGAIVYSIGGLVVDGGWIRILGSGADGLKRSLPGWNKSKTFDTLGEAPSYLLVADDAIGGFFLLNGGGLGEDVGKVYYLSPDNLEYESLDMSYSEFLQFCFRGDLESFYGLLRWRSWKADVAALSGDDVVSFFSYLWTKEGKDIESVHRGVVPVQEHYDFTMDMRRQLGLQK